jgi:hypothetical protein
MLNLKVILFLLFAVTGLQVQAASTNSLILCPLYHAVKLKKALPEPSTDKFKHCALSCQLALRCSALDTMALGVMKEVWDLVSPGNAEWEDLKADAIGIEFVLRKQAVSDKECNRQCKNIYW